MPNKFELFYKVFFTSLLLNADAQLLLSQSENNLRKNPFNKVSQERPDNQRYDFRKLLQMVFDESLNVFAPTSNAFTNDLCRNHSLLFKEGVKSKKLWAMSSKLYIFTF